MTKVREDQTTVKISSKTHKWLVENKKKTGAPVRFVIDQAVELYRKNQKG